MELSMDSSVDLSIINEPIPKSIEVDGSVVWLVTRTDALLDS